MYTETQSILLPQPKGKSISNKAHRLVMKSLKERQACMVFFEKGDQPVFKGYGAPEKLERLIMAGIESDPNLEKVIENVVIKLSLKKIGKLLEQRAVEQR